MSEVVNILMEYGLIRDIAEKIEQINKDAFKRDYILPFEEASKFALGVRISPHRYIKKWDGTYQPHKLPSELFAKLVYKYKCGRQLQSDNPHNNSDEYVQTFNCYTPAWERFDKKRGDIYIAKLRSALMNEGRCFYCKKPLQVDTSVYNNWQSYEDRRGYHKACKNYISPCKR